MGTLVFQATLGGSVNLIGPNTASTINFTLPNADGSSGQALITNGSGTLSFSSFATLGSNTFTGSQTLSAGTANGVTYLNGSKVLTSGSALTFDGTNLGVGTSSPAYKLDTQIALTGTAAGDNTAGYFSSLASGRDVNIRFGDSVNASARIGYLSGALYMYTNGAERLRLDTSGNVGIGMSSATNIQGDASRLLTYSSTAGTLSVTSGGYVNSQYAQLFLSGGYGDIGFVSGHYIRSQASTPYGAASDATLQFFATVRGSSPSKLMELNSAGNLGLGVTPSAWSTTFKGFQLGTTGSIWAIASGNGGTYYGNNYYYASGGRTYLTTGTAAEYSQAGGIHAWSTAASGTAGTAVSFTQAMTLDASGNLGVGTTSPFADSGYTSFTVNGNSTGSQINFQKSGTVYGQIVSNATNGLVLNAAQNTPMLFYTAGSERARIDSSGNLLVGQTSQAVAGFSSGKIVTSVSTQAFVGLASSSSGTVFCATTPTDGYPAYFYNSTTSTAVGYIRLAASSTTYATSSDYRLKENIAPMTGALTKVAQLKPCTYTWKIDGASSQGFIAHELAEVVPECVVGEKDAVDEEGNPKYQGIDTSFLVATLTAAIQEQQAIIQQLQADVAALKGN